MGLGWSWPLLSLEGWNGNDDGDGMGLGLGANPNLVSSGNYICVTVSTTYSQIPLALRPLSSITGNSFGIGAAKPVTGSATMVMQ